jgi:hypothetical protein
MSTFLSPDFLKFFLPLSGGAIGWLWSEHRKRQSEEYLRKEERYRLLLLSLRGFYIGAEDHALKQEFVDQLALSWLYCSDEVIIKANAFVLSMKPEAKGSEDTKNIALSALIGAIRRDLISRSVVRHTALTGAEFERVSVIARRI